jgi:hypothetical protein
LAERSAAAALIAPARALPTGLLMPSFMTSLAPALALSLGACPRELGAALPLVAATDRATEPLTPLPPLAIVPLGVDDPPPPEKRPPESRL